MEGDAKTKFFRTSTLNKRRRNRILALQNEVGEWIYDPKGIEDSIFQFYSSLFTTDHQSSANGTDTTPYESYTLLHREQNIIRDPMRNSEIKNALFSFKSSKAPGPDSLHPISTKSTGIYLRVR